LSDNITFKNQHYQIHQIAEFKTYGWQHRLTITAKDGRGKLLEMTGKSPQKLQIVSSRLSWQDVEIFQGLQSALDHYRQVRQLKDDAQRILLRDGVRDKSQDSTPTYRYDGQKYQIVWDEQSFRITAKDGRGEILNYPSSPYEHHPEVKAKINFTPQDVELFCARANQIEQQQREAERSWQLQQQKSRSQNHHQGLGR
jgi:hypothetical protein